MLSSLDMCPTPQFPRGDVKGRGGAVLQEREAALSEMSGQSLGLPLALQRDVVSVFQSSTGQTSLKLQFETKDCHCLEHRCVEIVDPSVNNNRISGVFESVFGRDHTLGEY